MSLTQHESPPGAGATELETGPYLLWPLLSEINLNESGEQDDTYITCVEHWNDNVYIGTSKGEVLHFVSIPPQDGEAQLNKTLIQAFRFHPVSNGGNDIPNAVRGIQQILILPTALKACILCNGTLTFYTLPELTPAFNSIKVTNCTWVGGINQNATQEQMEEDGGVEVLVCLKNRMRIVKLGDSTTRMGDIEIGGCIAAARRDNVASVADGKSYSLVDVVEKQMIPLFNISTLEQSSNDSGNEQPEASPTDTEVPTPEGGEVKVQAGVDEQSSNTAQNVEDDNDTGITMEDNEVEEQASTNTETFPPRSSSKVAVEASNASTNVKASPLSPQNPPAKGVNTKDQQQGSNLIPHILSPNPDEFLLTTGTSFEEPGVGMFVSLEGDVVPRPPLEFARYPSEIVIDGSGNGSQGFEPDEAAIQNTYIVSLFQSGKDTTPGSLEIQKLALDPSEPRVDKQTIDIKQYLGASNNELSQARSGLRTMTSAIDIALDKVVEILALKPVPLKLFPSLASAPKMDENKSSDVRQREEQKFIERLSNTRSQITVWTNDCLWNVVRNPLILRLDAQLQLSRSPDSSAGYAGLDRQKVEFVINDIRGLEPTSELEFFALKLVRQKASLLLFLNLVYRTLAVQNMFERDTQITEEVLLAGEIDPRVVLAAVPSLCEEIVIGSEGLWLQGGLLSVLNEFVSRQDLPANLDVNSTFSTTILPMVKRFLFSWRRKKGFGSITDEDAVFKSVDAALMRLLLLLDGASAKGPAVKGSVRSELYAVVDRGVDSFERAITLLETHKRLYVLSRLYQSRKMSAQVLATWKRILEGDEDVGGEFIDGFNEVRRYLSYLKDPALVQEYGCWLAKRSPKLGVQVFADENSRVKFQPKQVVEILKREAPVAVKEYLEYLVFGKKLPQYADDLVGYYFDSVITELENSPSARTTIMQTYEDYRALDLPKPTYTQYIAGKEIEDDWWRNRIRLLQLLGGSHGATSQYDVKNVLQRIAPYERELVPELIIVYGRQGRHSEAIRLLTHGLGDLDTAITYCVMGGSSTYTPTSGFLSRESVSSREEQENLFKALLGEFLKIENPKTCMAQTSELLDRFASWFDIAYVLNVVPDSWPVDALLGFLENRFRHLISERNQSAIERALVSVQNLGVGSKLVEKIEALGPIIQELHPDIAT